MSSDTPWQRVSLVAVVVALIAAVIVVGGERSSAAPIAGFRESEVIRGLSGPTAVNVAPDGRIFVSQQSGKLRVIKDGVLLPTPFLSVPVSQTVTTGLLGMAFDPEFPQQPYVYVFYTASTPNRHSRVSRFTAQGDVAVPGSEVVLLDLPTLADVQINHDGGDLAFGADGKLYVTVGDNVYSLNGQNLSTTFGKLLRINKDGTIPSDNPFFATSAGINRAIYAYGLRNPFKMAVQPTTGRMFVNDVGNAAWEEVNEVERGANFGWALTEGPTSDQRFRGPLFSYSHATGTPVGCSVTGGAFYEPPVTMFPEQYVGDYFLSDYCANWVGVLDLSSAGTPTFTRIVDIPSPVDLDVDRDGSLLVLSQAHGGVLYRLSYESSLDAPTFDTHPEDQEVDVGQSATFTCAVSGSPQPSLRWQRNGVDLPGATGGTLVVPTVSMADDGASFRCVATNSAGSAESNAAVLAVRVPSQPPTATILTPVVGAEYSGSDVISFTGAGSDPEDGPLPPSSYEWEVVFHHDQHTHPFILPFTGSSSGSMTIPVVGEVDVDQWYRIRLTVTDSGGNRTTATRDIHPRVSGFAVRTDPPGLTVLIDGQPTVAPVDVMGVVGTQRAIGVVSPQAAGGGYWAFDAWTHGLGANQVVTVASTVGDYEARFVPTSSARVVDGVVGVWDFVDGSGSLVGDSSGRGSPLDLVIEDPSRVRWVDGGLSLDRSTRVSSSGAATKLVDAARESGEFTLEAWVSPDVVTETNGRLAGLSKDPWTRNAELVQERSSLSGRMRSSLSSSTVKSPSGVLEVGRATHVVLTRTADGETTLVVDGVAQASVASWGDLSMWDRSMPFVVGNVAVGNDRPFIGVVHLVAFYDRALTVAEVQRNYDAGPRAGSVGSPPLVVSGPTSTSVSEGETAVLSVVATGAGPLSYQWLRNGLPLEGASGSELMVGPVTPADDGTRFAVVVTGSAGAVTSPEAVLSVPTSSARVVDGVVGVWDFVDGSGSLVGDSSGRGSPLDLVIEDPSRVRWVDGGLSLDRSTRVSSSGAATKLVDAARESGEFTLEAWVSPDVVTETNGRLAGLSKDPWTRNAELVQERSSLSGRMRSSLSSSTVKSPSGVLEVGRATHVVLTRTADGETTLVVDGVAQASVASWGDLSMWDRSMPFVVGNVAVGNDRPFIGVVHLVAFYDRALTVAEVQRNYDAGPRAGSVGSPPLVVSGPTSTSVSEGETAVLSVVATGAGPLSYQWLRNGLPLEGASGSELMVGPVTPADDGTRFAVVVTGSAGAVTSPEAVLSVPTSSARVVDGVVGVWDFVDGSGSLVGDSSGRGSPLDLVIEDPSRVRWVDGGLSLDRSTRVSSSGAATKLVDAARESGEFTLEAWVSPDVVTETNGRLAGLSKDPWTRNAELVQERSSLSGRMRSSLSSSTVKSPSGVLEVGRATHVVLTRTADGETTLVVDGVAQASVASWGDLSMWDRSMPFVVGNVAVGNDRPFIGVVHLVAFYDRALTVAEVQRNYDAGPRAGSVGSPP